MRTSLEGAEKVIIIGAGLLGLELAAASHARGKRVTIVDIEDAPLGRVLGSQVGGLVAEVHRASGVTILSRARVARFGGDVRVRTVELQDGRILEADLVLVAIGAEPATSWLEGSGIELMNGVVVNASGESNIPGIFAAGDVATWFNAELGVHVRIEHFGSAHAQGLTVGRAMAGLDAAHAPLPSCSSEYFGRRLQFVGFRQGDEDVVVRRSDAGFSAFYLRNARVVAAAALNSPRDFMAMRKLVAARAAVDRDELADAQRPVSDFASELA